MNILRIQDYNFINYIVNKFDKTYFPDHAPKELTLIREDSKHQFHSIHGCMREKLPPELILMILEQATNFSDWVVISGILNPKVPRLDGLNNASASSLLNRLDVPLNDQQAQEQLINHVFDQVWQACSVDDKKALIQQSISSGSIQPTLKYQWMTLSLKIQRSITKICSACQNRLGIDRKKEIMSAFGLRTASLLVIASLLALISPLAALLVFALYLIMALSFGVWFISITIISEVDHINQSIAHKIENRLLQEGHDQSRLLWLKLMKNPATFL